MKTISSIAWCTLFFSMATTAFALDEKQSEMSSRAPEAKTAPVEIQLKVPASDPLFSRFPIATVNDDVIRMDELTEALASSHAEKSKQAGGAGKIDYTRILDRLINIRLIAQEAANIGLDELPEFKSETEANTLATSADLVMKEISKDAKADPREVEKRFKELVVEWKIKSVMFEKEDDAKAITDAMKAGKNFDELTKKAIDEKKAKGGEQGEYLKPKDLLPQIAAAASVLEVGAVGPVIKLASEKQTRFVLLKLEDKRYPENPVARQRAEQSALTDKRNEVLAEYKKMLFNTQVTIKEKLLDKIDYDSPKTNFQKLLSDTRAVAEFKDGKTITVGALTEGLQKKFFHGLEQAGKDKFVDKAKRSVLGKLIEEQLINNEAVRRGVEKSDQYQERIKEFQFSELLGLFIEKVVIPDIKVTDDEMRSYFQDHKGEYTDPEMLKMASLDFGNKRDAEAALAKLKKGTDINWVRANAEGLVASTDEEGGLTGGAMVLTTKSLPEEMARSLAGVKSGDYRLSAGSEGRFSVLAIQEVIPARQQPYEEVRKEIWKKAFDADLSKAMEDWFHKLRAAASVKIYLSAMGK
jgi:hypothetical protein